MKKRTKPSKAEKALAAETIDFLESYCPQLLKDTNSGSLNLTIEEQAISVEIPRSAFNIFTSILRSMSEGKTIDIQTTDTILTTQQAAERIGVSRPHIVKLLEQGKIAHVKVGKHRRIKLTDLLSYMGQQD